MLLAKLGLRCQFKEAKHPGQWPLVQTTLSALSEQYSCCNAVSLAAEADEYSLCKHAHDLDSVCDYASEKQNTPRDLCQ